MTLTRPRYSPGGWTDAPAALGAGRGLPARTAQPNRRRDPMSTPTISGIDRDDLIGAIRRAMPPTPATVGRTADAALAYIAAHHECACDREHDDDETEARPDTCCGKCPPIVGGGFDCTCEGNPRCVKAAYPALHSWATGSSVEGPVLAEDAHRLLDTLGWKGKPACDREHADEWVEVDESTWDDLPDGTRLRREWERGAYAEFHHFVYRDDLPDPDADLVERMAQASFCVGDLTRGDWQAAGEDVKEKWRRWSRAALAVVREGER